MGEQLLPEWTNLLVITPVGAVSEKPFEVMEMAVSATSNQHVSESHIPHNSDVLFLLRNQTVNYFQKLRLCSLLSVLCNQEHEEVNHKKKIAARKSVIVSTQQNLWYHVCD